MNTPETITVYRFRDYVAMHSSDSPTIYLSQKQALALAIALGECAHDISAHDFQRGTFPTTTIIEPELTP